MKTIYISQPKPCSFCGEPALFDDKTLSGRWADMCQIHHDLHAHPLFTGGYRLIVGEEPERTRADVQREVNAAVMAGDWTAFEDAIGDGDPAEWL
jgi:hypothetical protein